jgi:hypothetical protein
MVAPDAYALVYGNMVNSERTADYISHVSGEDEVEFHEDPSEIRLHGENLQPVNLSGYRRDFSHVMSEDLMPEDWGFDSMMDMLREQYPGTENRGGLNIREDEGSEINAVLVPMTDEELEFYESRELGYHLEEVQDSRIDTEVDLPVLAAVSHNRGDADPIVGYVEDCIASWENWSVDHRNRFLETTRLDGETLHEWASRKQVI